MTTLAILGTGRVASALVPALAAAGHSVTVGTRSDLGSPPDWAHVGATFAPVAQAVASAAVVINATPGESSLQRLCALRQELTGKVLIDVSNAVERGQEGLPGTLTYPTGSLAEELQKALPETRVVKTLNTMLFTVMADPASVSIPATAFMSGDDAGAKTVVRSLLHDLGWQDERILDLGDIHTARGPEAMILIVPDIIRARGFAPFAVTIAT